MEFLFASDYYFLIFNEMVKFYQGMLSGGVDRALLAAAVGSFVIIQLSNAAVKTKVKEYRVFATAAKYVVAVITILAAMEEAGIGNSTVQTFASAFALMLALAGGLAFGLGGQYQAKDILEDFKHRVAQK